MHRFTYHGRLLAAPSRRLKPRRTLLHTLTPNARLSLPPTNSPRPVPRPPPPSRHPALVPARHCSHRRNMCKHFGAEGHASIDITKGREVLPANVKPVHYDLTLEPDFANFTYQGTVTIEYVPVRPYERALLTLGQSRCRRRHHVHCPQHQRAQDPLDQGHGRPASHHRVAPCRYRR